MADLSQLPENIKTPVVGEHLLNKLNNLKSTPVQPTLPSNQENQPEELIKAQEVDTVTVTNNLSKHTSTEQLNQSITGNNEKVIKTQESLNPISEPKAVNQVVPGVTQKPTPVEIEIVKQAVQTITTTENKPEKITAEKLVRVGKIGVFNVDKLQDFLNEQRKIA
jgi:hypothetical protein